MKSETHKDKTEVKTLPGYVQVEPTVRCNSDCRMCNRRQSGRLSGDMSLSQFQRIIDQIPTAQSILVQGVGEPLLNPDFFKMVQYCSSKGMKVYTNTNASCIDRTTAEKLLESGIHQIRISLDAITAEKYEYIRKGLSFKKVYDNIMGLFAARGRSSTPEIHFSVVGMMDNIHQLPDIIDFAFTLGVAHIQLLNLYITGEGIAVHQNSLVKNYNEEIAAVLKKAEQACRQAGILFTGPIFDYQETHQHVLNCKWPWEWTNITYEGWVTPCCVVDNPLHLNFGNCLREDFSHIWNNLKYRKFRDHFIRGDIPRVCQQCIENRFILKQYGSEGVNRQQSTETGQ